jgi:hypothetical protein
MWLTSRTYRSNKEIDGEMGRCVLLVCCEGLLKIK